ncbi:MAG: choice-of-anchor Q domain-containing protein [Ilumatobacteraceae bacterium]
MKASLAHPASSSTRRVTRACVAGALVSLVGLTFTDHVAHADSYSVTTTDDGGAGSLRDAITQANNHPGPDIINVPAGTYTLTIAGTNEDSNATGDLDITGETTIIGAGSGSTTIDANGIDRAIELTGGPVTLQSLTITNGSVPGGSGGNLLEHNSVDLTVADSVISNGNASYGGGIAGGVGVLNILRTALVGNSVVGVSGSSGVGAAISKVGAGQASLVMTDSLVTNNHADQNALAIMYVTAGLTVTNSTISGNTAYSRIVLLEAQQSENFAASLDHVTIANNTTVSLGGGGAGLSINLLSPAVMPVTVTGSLFVNNVTGATSSNCSLSGDGGPTVTSGGYNLSDDATCISLTQPGDLADNHVTTLGALGDNGGPTRTLALMAGSSAIDAAGTCALSTDQRGVARPQGVACDIGAFEAAGAVDPTTTETPTTATPTTEAPSSTLVEPPTTEGPGSTPVEPPTSVTQTTLDSGVVSITTLPPATTALPIVTMPPFADGQLPTTGSSHLDSLWLAALVCSLGALMVLTARRRVR